MFFCLSFVTLFLAAVALGTPVKRDAADVGSDITSLRSKVLALDTSIKALPSSGGTLAQIMAIHDGATEVETAVQTTTNDVTASDVFTDAQADTIDESLTELAATVKEALNDLEAKQPAISALNADPIAESDLQDLKVDTDALGNEILAKTPAGKQSSAQQKFSAIDSALSDAISKF